MLRLLAIAACCPGAAARTADEFRALARDAVGRPRDTSVGFYGKVVNTCDQTDCFRAVVAGGGTNYPVESPDLANIYVEANDYDTWRQNDTQHPTTGTFVYQLANATLVFDDTGELAVHRADRQDRLRLQRDPAGGELGLPSLLGARRDVRLQRDDERGARALQRGKPRPGGAGGGPLHRVGGVGRRRVYVAGFAAAVGALVTTAKNKRVHVAPGFHEGQMRKCTLI